MVLESIGIDATGIGTVIIGWIYMAISILVLVGGGVAFYWLVFKKANYRYKVVVVDTTTKPETYSNDRGAIIKDGVTKRILFKLLKNNVNLNPEYMERRSTGRGKDIVFVGRYD
jgi:predicted phosphoribosyltransferase